MPLDAISGCRYLVCMDWKKIIAALLADGWTQERIAQAVGCGQSTVSELARGVSAQPRGNTAIELLRLHSLRRPLKSEAA